MADRHKPGYMKMRYERLMNEARISLGGKCQVCGTAEKLDFDHIYPSTKLFNIGQVFTVSIKSFWLEVAKCQLLCRQHHVDKTLTDNGLVRSKDNHGTLSCYTHSKCRCNLCRTVHNRYMVQYFQRKPRSRKNNIDMADYVSVETSDFISRPKGG
jgi:hypothetical protein